MNISVAEAKKDHQRGLLAGFIITDLPGEGWTLSLTDERENSMGIVDARTRQLRTFKTLAAAINTAREIGFKANNLSGNN